MPDTPPDLPSARLTLEHCTFGYRRARQVLSDFSVQFDAGRTVLLGPNGAGKSTLLGILASALRPDAGRLEFIDGEMRVQAKAQLKRYRSTVAWLPQKTTLFSGLTVQEHVAYTGWLKGMSRRDAWNAASSALAQVDLIGSADKRAKELSGGQMRRVALAGALVHEAKVLLFDEPTAGLDPTQRRHFREILARLDPETVVIVSTHLTDDIEESFDHLKLIDQSTLRFEGTVDAFASVETGSTARTFSERLEHSYSRLVRRED